MKKVLLEKGYRHCDSDNEFTVHCEYARNAQFVYSKEFKKDRQKVIDLIYLSADMVAEKIVIGFFREDVSIENGVLENADVGIPLAKFSIQEFEKTLDRLIPRGNPLRRSEKADDPF
jgi:hypothetical protein